EPRALMLAVENRIDPIKRLQHQRNILGTNAHSGISDADAQTRRLNPARDGNAPARGGEFYAVADQVDEYLLQLDRIGVEHWPGRWVPFDDHLDLGVL